jgi:hypothetical protein
MNLTDLDRQGAQMPMTSITPLFSQFKKFLLVAMAIGLSAGCSAKKSGGFVTSDGSRISKGTATQPAVTTENDVFITAFNEIAWSRQAAALSINPPSLSSQEGCVLHKPLKGVRFLYDSYDCKRESDDSDLALGRRHELSGALTYSLDRGFYEISGTFSSHIFALKTAKTPETLISQGSITRDVQILAPTGVSGLSNSDSGQLKTSIYKQSSTANYAGDVAQDSQRQPENWQAKFDGSLTATTALPLTMIVGSGLTFSYTPEADAGIKRAPQTLELTATSDILFVATGSLNGSCLRPVGTFSWTMGVAGAPPKVGTLTTTAAGYLRSDEKDVHAWGKRCLER